MANKKENLARDIITKYFREGEIWGLGYKPLLPATLQDFSLSSILPVIIYMMRWRKRRGSGEFIKYYGSTGGAKIKEKAAKIHSLSSKIVKNSEEKFVGFEGEIEQNILGDLLLAYCFENRKHLPSRDEPIQRVLPTHYFSSWIDLPERVANLRGIPELIYSILVFGGKSYKPTKNVEDQERNPILKTFSIATILGDSANRQSDEFDEDILVGIDQLITIRIAQTLKEAPNFNKGNNKDEMIPNYLPIDSESKEKILDYLPASKSAENLRVDINTLLKAYEDSIPRFSLISILETCISIGLTNILLSTLKIAFEWEKTGEIIEEKDQKPWNLFVDCSLGIDRNIKSLAEESLNDIFQRLHRLPVIMMCMRVLNHYAKDEMPKIIKNKVKPIEHLNYLGKILHNGLEEYQDIQRDFRKMVNKLTNSFEELQEEEKNTEYQNIIDILNKSQSGYAMNIAETIVYIMGDKLNHTHVKKFFDSCTMANETNGIVQKRSSRLSGTSIEKRSMVLSNTALDFLVHRHVIKESGGIHLKNLSLESFIKILKERYGFYVDEAPEGFSFPTELLKRNRAFLEKRLRDMGLLIGVNDAESMKRLRSRFKTKEEI